MPEKTGVKNINRRVVTGSGSAGDNNKKKKKKKKKNVVLRVFLILIGIVFLLGLIAAIGGFALFYSYIKDVPEFDPGMLQPAVTSYIFDSKDREIANLYYDQNRIEIPLESIPLHVQRAFVAIEDERFYEHYGVDPMAILRALITNIKTRNMTVQGGSTITQQIIKTAFLTPEKNLERKAQEAWLAFQMERKYSKNEILEIYLNQVPFAHGAYGIESAANTYFNKTAAELTLSEAALLAAIPRSPNYYSPFSNYDAAKERQGLVLRKMYELGYITLSEMTSARDAEIIFGEIPTRQYDYPYFVDYVLHRELISILTSLPAYKTREEAYEAIYNMGLKVYTTLDTDIQESTESIIGDEKLYPQNIRVDMALLKEIMSEKQLNGYPKEVLNDEEGILQPQGASVVANPVTGEVYALVGGREYSKNNQDLRFLSRRQPGSAIKPILDYAPAMQENLITPGSIIDDAPFARGNWAPENFDRRFRGLVTVREAIVPSLNVPAIKTLSQLTPEIGLDYLKKMGVSSIQPDDYNLASAIGGMTLGVSPFDMAQAYAVLANQGIKVDFHTVTRIEDRNGRIIYEHRSEPQTVLSPQTAFMITDILKDVVRRGTASRINIGRPVAAKTGTTSDNRDAYLVAYTPNLVVSVWLGHDIPMTGIISGGSGATINFMNAILSSALQDKESLDFVRPTGITGPISICSKSGLRPGPYCPPEAITSEIFPSTHLPQETCNLHMEMNICTVSGLLAEESCPQEPHVFLLRPEYEVTDGRWRSGAGRAPEDAGQQPPKEYCPGHSGIIIDQEGKPEGFTGNVILNPLRNYLRWGQSENIREYLLYKRPEGREIILLERFPGNVTQFIDEQIEDGEVYIYFLVAINEDGERSKASEVVLATPGASNNQGRSGEENIRDDTSADDENDGEDEDETYEGGDADQEF